MFCLRPFAFAAGPLVRSRPSLRTLRRPFSQSTIRWNVQPEIQELIPFLRKVSFYHQIQNNESAIKAMLDFNKILLEEGFDMASPPGKLGMMRLFANKNIRQGLLAVEEEFSKAGVDMQAAMKEIASLQFDPDLDSHTNADSPKP